DAALDLELLVAVALLAELRDDLGRRRGILERPSHPGHSSEALVQLRVALERATLEGLLDEAVLHHLVLDTRGAEAVAQLRDARNVDTGEVHEDDGRRLVELLLNRSDDLGLLFARSHFRPPPVRP